MSPTINKKLHTVFMQHAPPALKYRVEFFRVHGRLPNIRNPKTWSEKVQHRKLFDRDPRIPRFIDKIEAKRLVSDIIGSDWIIPTLWEGTSAKDIPWSRLAPPFVIKCTHGSGFNYFVTPENCHDREAATRNVERWLATDFGATQGEWSYSQVQPRVLIEPMLIENGAVPKDYKLYVINRTVYFILVITDRFTDHREAIFNKNWEREPFCVGHFPAIPLEQRIPRPSSLSRMIEAAERIGAEFTMVRVDFYEVDGRSYFGEATFFPSSGFERFTPVEYDARMGALWKYP